MNKQEIIEALNQNYKSFVEYINGLSKDDYYYSYEGKWTAGQQLEHIVMSVKPLVQVFSMDEASIEKNFGKTDRVGVSYDVLLQRYIEKLDGGGKAPERFVPQNNITAEKEILIDSLNKLLSTFCSKIESFEEEH